MNSDGIMIAIKSMVSNLLVTQDPCMMNGGREIGNAAVSEMSVVN